MKHLASALRGRPHQRQFPSRFGGHVDHWFQARRLYRALGPFVSPTAFAAPSCLSIGMGKQPVFAGLRGFIGAACALQLPYQQLEGAPRGLLALLALRHSRQRLVASATWLV
jgi:hypothetical protein